jgi:hypothetical protein
MVRPGVSRVGLWESRKRWAELRRGELSHPDSLGNTWFDFLPLREDWIYRFVDPALTFLAGALLRYRLDCGLLGLWMMAAGIAFVVVEQAVHENGIEHDFDILAGLFDAKRDAGTMGGLIDGPKPTAPNGTPAGSIPTGADAQLKAVIARRKKEIEDANSEGGVQ